MEVLTYVKPTEPVAQDTRLFEKSNGLMWLNWLQTANGHALDPEFLRAVERLRRRFESDPRITAYFDAPTSVLQWARVMSKRDRINFHRGDGLVETG